MLIINLGPNCELAGILKDYNILELRSPFDSVITSHPALCSCLKDKFQQFSNREYFKLYFDRQSIINYYGIVLAHNFELKEFNQNLNESDLINECYKQTNFHCDDISKTIEYYIVNKNKIIHDLQGGGIIDFNEKSYNNFLEKYKRRINRFFERADGDNIIYYFRCIEKIEEIYEIFNILNQYYNNKNYYLIGIIRINTTNFKIKTNNSKIIVYNKTSFADEKIFYDKLFLNFKDIK